VLLPLAACANSLGGDNGVEVTDGDPLPVAPADDGEDPIDEDPPADDPPSEDPPAEDPPFEDPPAEDPPAEDPPAEDPSTEPSLDVGSPLPLHCPTEDAASTRAVLVIEKGWGGGVRLLQLDDKGVLRDTTDRVDVDLPQSVTFRDDGLEALVTWGNSSDEPAGVLVISLAADGSSMTLEQDITLGPDAAPLEVGYTSHDSAIVTRIGPGNDDLVPLFRNSDGKMQAGTPWDVPGEWPQRAVGIPGQDNQALLLRADILAPENGSEVIPISDAGGVITTTGAPVALSQRNLFLYMHPDGERAYVPTGDPADDDTLNPAGQLEILSPSSGTWASAPTPFALPERASLASISPNADVMVFADSIAAWGSTGTYIQNAWYGLYRVQLDGSGMPVFADTDEGTFPASLVYDVEQSPHGHTVVAYDTGSLVSGVSDVVVVYAHREDGWAQLCGAIEIDGPAELALSPRM
jgi:hypothetical protein